MESAYLTTTCICVSHLKHSQSGLIPFNTNREFYKKKQQEQANGTYMPNGLYHLPPVNCASYPNPCLLDEASTRDRNGRLLVRQNENSKDHRSHLLLFLDCHMKTMGRPMQFQDLYENRNASSQLPKGSRNHRFTFLGPAPTGRLN